MTSTTTSPAKTSVVVFDPTFSDADRLAVAGRLAGYRGLTRDAYASGQCGLRFSPPSESDLRSRLGKSDKLTARQLDGFYHDLLARGLSPSSVRRFHSVLHSGLGRAVN